MGLVQLSKNFFLTAERVKFFVVFYRMTDKKVKAMNFGSYNYLGFSENHGPCADAVREVVSNYGSTTCASRQELGEFSFTHLSLMEFPTLINWTNPFRI